MSAIRALVVCESGYGTTTDVADRVGSSLEATGHVADVRNVGDADGVADYDLVVVGSPIRYDRWMPAATAFVRRNRWALVATNVGFFFTCLALSKPGPASTRSADRYEERIRAIAPEVEPLAIGRFAGAVVPSRMNPFLRTAARAFLATRGVTAGDHRNWDEIDAWTDQLTATFARR